ncbi:MAG: TolC family protein [Terricaulis sp.]
MTTIALMALAAAMPAAADTLDEAMASAVNSNPQPRGPARATRREPGSVAPSLGRSVAASPRSRRARGASNSYGTTTNGVSLDNSPRDESWNGSASASQLLWSSGRILATTRAARASIRGAVADYDFTLQQLLLDVARAYADVRQTQAIVAAREQTVSNLSRLFEYAQAQFGRRRP